MDKMMKVKGYQVVEIELPVKNALDAIFAQMGFNDRMFIQNDKICENVDVGTHKTEYEPRVRFEYPYMVERFKLLKELRRNIDTYGTEKAK